MAHIYRTSRIKLSHGQVFWREAGDSHRPAIVFLHGSWQDGKQWQEIVEPLSKNFHCTIPDLLGFGSSIAIATPNSIEIEVDCLHEFINALKLKSIYLVGHSLGAWIAIGYALKYPDAVRGIVTIAPEGYSMSTWKQYGSATKFLLSHPHLFNLWFKSIDTLAAIGDGVRLLQKNRNYWNFFKKFPTTCKLFFERSPQEIRRELVADRLSQLRPPLLILQSESDDRSVIEQSQSFARALRKAEYKAVTADRQESLLQIALEIQAFCNRIQLQIDREEVELW